MGALHDRAVERLTPLAGFAAPASGDRDERGRGGAEFVMPSGVRCSIGWEGARHGQPAGPLRGEELIQAACGIMAVHGRDQGWPRRLGLDAATTAATVLASQGMLASLLAIRRGRRVRAVETSVLDAGLLFVAHHLAMATSADTWAPASSGTAPGPPFRTADGAWFELEVPGRDAWRGFWHAVGVPDADAEDAWPAFAYRYNTGTCRLPPSLQQAVGRLTWEEATDHCDRHRVAFCRVRGCSEVLPEWDEAAVGPPDLSDLDPGSGTPTPSLAAIAPRGRHPVLDDAPLAGMRLVEITHGLPGPLAGHLLALLGATVVRIEPPGGDPGRRLRPLAGSLGAAFLAYNRNKQAVEADYTTTEGRETIRELARNADILLHNWLPGRAERLGLDAASLARINPRLVHASISGWGDSRSDRERPGIEYFVQAHAGVGDALHPTGEPPAPSRLILAGVMSALLACEAVLAALCRRERSNTGIPVETSLLAGALTLQTPVLRALAAGAEQGRTGGRPVWTLLDTPLATAEGHLMLGAMDGAARRRLAEVLGLPGHRTPTAASFEHDVAERVQDRPASEWAATLGAAEVPSAVVTADLASLPTDPRCASAVEPVAGACWAPGPPWRFHS